MGDFGYRIARNALRDGSAIRFDRRIDNTSLPPPRSAWAEMSQVGRAHRRGSYATDPLCQACEQAWKAGIVVVAAGNGGRLNSTQRNLRSNSAKSARCEDAAAPCSARVPRAFGCGYAALYLCASALP